MMRYRSAATVAWFILLGAAAPLPDVPVYREFGRWLVACDNTRACVARGFDEVTQAQLDLTRSAGEAAPTLSLSAADPIDLGAIRLDDKPLAFPAPAWSSKDDTVFTSDPAAIAAFVAAARDAHAITLDAAPQKDDPPRAVPLNGFTAALLLMDAVQGRPGTPTSLVASKGTDTPASMPSLPPAPTWIAPPSLSHTEVERLTRQAGRLHSVAFDPCEVHEAPKVFALDQTSALAIRPCYMAAYQGSSVVAVLGRSDGTERPLKLTLPGLPKPTTDGPDMVDPEFDPATGTLFSSSKGRGLADCGLSEAWVWSKGAFRLTSLNYQAQCGGAAPGDWPPLFRTR